MFVIQENECVVERVLTEVQDSFGLIHILPEWVRRGLPVFEEGEPPCKECVVLIVLSTQHGNVSE